MMQKALKLVQFRSIQPFFKRFSPAFVRPIRFSSSAHLPQPVFLTSTRRFSIDGVIDVHGKTEEVDRHAHAEATDDELLNRLLKATVEQIPVYGWTREAVEAACEAESLPAGSHAILMPNGPIDLVSRFASHCNAELVKQMSEWRKDAILPSTGYALYEPFADKAELDAFLARSIETRLRMLVPVKSQWPQAMAIMAMPPNVPPALGLLAELVDEIWAHAGDRSTDMNWYAKRMGLAYVYNLTEIHLLQDSSEDHQESWQFLQRRLIDLRACKQADLRSVASMLKEGLLAFGNVTNALLGTRRR